MIQAVAMLQDSLRHLRSRYLFWVVLVVSCLAAVLLFSFFSFNDRGISFLGLSTFENPALVKGSPETRGFVAGIFNGFFVRFWLSWGAIILALISTASILPDFLQSGAIDVIVSKPIARLRLLLLKFLGALLFVVVQIAAGVGLAYLIIGIRFDMWLHGAFWAIPLITLQFVYLYAFSTLLAVITRSTMACLLGTFLFWFVIFIIQFTANSLTETVETARFQVETADARVTAMNDYIADLDREPNALENRQLERLRERAEANQRMYDNISPWERWFNLGEMVIPKTGDAQKILAQVTEAPVATEFASLFVDFESEEFRTADMSPEEMRDMADAEIAGQRARRSVDAVVSISTSLGFTALLLLIAGWLFKRRDL